MENTIKKNDKALYIASINHPLLFRLCTTYHPPYMSSWVRPYLTKLKEKHETKSEGNNGLTMEIVDALLEQLNKRQTN